MVVTLRSGAGAFTAIEVDARNIRSLPEQISRLGQQCRALQRHRRIDVVGVGVTRVRSRGRCHQFLTYATGGCGWITAKRGFGTAEGASRQRLLNPFTTVAKTHRSGTAAKQGKAAAFIGNLFEAVRDGCCHAGLGSHCQRRKNEY